MKVGRQILWNVTPICETSQIYYLMGRRLMKDVSCNHLKDRLFHLVHWLSITYNCEGLVKNPSIWKESLTLDCSSDTLCTQLVADLEELETMDASEIYSKRLNAKEVIFPKEKGEFLFPTADWTNQNSRRRSGTENIHLDTAATKSRRRSR